MRGGQPGRIIPTALQADHYRHRAPESAMVMVAEVRPDREP